MQNTPKTDCLSLFYSRNTFAISIRSNLSMLSLCIESSMACLTVTVSLYCVTSFWYVASLKLISQTAWKVSKYGVYSGPYFPVFSPNTEKTPYLDTFHAVLLIPFVAGDKRYNLRRIVTSEKNSLSSPEHCFLYLIIPGMIFSSYSINLIPNNCAYVDRW